MDTQQEQPPVRYSMVLGIDERSFLSDSESAVSGSVAQKVESATAGDASSQMENQHEESLSLDIQYAPSAAKDATHPEIEEGVDWLEELGLEPPANAEADDAEEVILVLQAPSVKPRMVKETSPAEQKRTTPIEPMFDFPEEGEEQGESSEDGDKEPTFPQVEVLKEASKESVNSEPKQPVDSPQRSPAKPEQPLEPLARRSKPLNVLVSPLSAPAPQPTEPPMQPPPLSVVEEAPAPIRKKDQAQASPDPPEQPRSKGLRVTFKKQADEEQEILLTDPVPKLSLKPSVDADDFEPLPAPRRHHPNDEIMKEKEKPRAYEPEEGQRQPSEEEKLLGVEESTMRRPEPGDSPRRDAPRPLTYDQCSRAMQKTDLSPYFAETEAPRTCWQKLTTCFANPPVLEIPEVLAAWQMLLALSRRPLDSARNEDMGVLYSVWSRMLPEEEFAVASPSWRKVGFRTSQPLSEDVVGTLGFLQMLYALSCVPRTTREMLQISQMEKTAFPFATMSMQATATALKLVKAGVLHRDFDRLHKVENIFNFFYFGVFFYWFQKHFEAPGLVQMKDLERPIKANAMTVVHHGQRTASEDRMRSA